MQDTTLLISLLLGHTLGNVQNSFWKAHAWGLCGHDYCAWCFLGEQHEREELGDDDLEAPNGPGNC